MSICIWCLICISSPKQSASPGFSPASLFSVLSVWAWTCLLPPCIYRLSKWWTFCKYHVIPIFWQYRKNRVSDACSFPSTHTHIYASYSCQVGWWKLQGAFSPHCIRVETDWLAQASFMPDAWNFQPNPPHLNDRWNTERIHDFQREWEQQNH